MQSESIGHPEASPAPLPHPHTPTLAKPGFWACVCPGPNLGDGHERAHVCSSFFTVVTWYQHHKEVGQFASQVEASVPSGADSSSQEAGQVDASTRLCLFFPFPSIWAPAR